MRKDRGVTLVELMLSLAMLGILVLAISSAATSLYSLKKDFLDKQATLVQSYIAAESIFERVLRATAINAAGFTLGDSVGGHFTSVSFRRPGLRGEKIYLKGNQVMYDPDTGDSDLVDRSILTGVQDLKFFVVSPQRLGAELTLTAGETVRTVVQPRNVFTIVQRSQ